MSDFEQEHLLIDFIQHYPFLYDKSQKDYKDAKKNDLAWETIAPTINITGRIRNH